MPVEIERKFLVDGDAWRTGVRRRELFRQGYLAGSELCSARVRVAGDLAWIGLKGRVQGASRLEYEYEIPLHEGNEILDRLCAGGRIEKWRHWVPHAGHEWEVDEFIELDDEAEAFARPSWLGAEVTHDARYFNSYLASHPWRTWPDAARAVR